MSIGRSRDLKLTNNRATQRPSRQGVPAAKAPTQRAAPIEDKRPAATAQLRLKDAVETSPYVAAQRQRLTGMLTQDREKQESVQRRADGASRNATGLPDQLKSGVEALSGVSLDHVKVHYNSALPEQLSALAYAQGGDIHLAPGQEKHLPHEAWHVVQQAQGRVKPTRQLKSGVPVNDDAGLEHEADVMGASAAVKRSPEPVAWRAQRRRATPAQLVGGKEFTSFTPQTAEEIEVFRGQLEEMIVEAQSREKGSEQMGECLRILTWVHNTTLNVQKGKLKENPLRVIKKGDVIHAVMILEDRAHSKQAKMPRVSREALEIAFLANAPHNIGRTAEQGAVKGGPTAAMELAIRESEKKGYEGRVVLGAENATARGQYEKKGFVKKGESSFSGDEMELSPEKAQEFLATFQNLADQAQEAPSGCCYLTTACTQFRGLADDCEELTVLRRFRDGWLMAQPAGPALIEEYYRDSPRLVSAIQRRDDREELLRLLYGVVASCVQAIKAGDYEFAFDTYCAMVRTLREELPA